MKSESFLFAALVIVCALIGCEDHGVVSDQTQSTWGSASVSGTLLIFMENGDLKDDLSGAEIFLKGTSKRTTTDREGYWMLRNIPAGKYDCVAALPGYGYKVFTDLEISGSDAWPSVYLVLAQTPSYEVADARIDIARDTIRCSGTVSNEVPYNRYLALYYGKSDPIHDSSSTWTLSYELTHSANRRDFSFRVMKQALLISGFSSGEVVHVAVYPISRYYESYFLLSELKKIITSGIGENPKRLQFVLP